MTFIFWPELNPSFRCLMQEHGLSKNRDNTHGCWDRNQLNARPQRLPIHCATRKGERFHSKRCCARRELKQIAFGERKGIMELSAPSRSLCVCLSFLLWQRFLQSPQRSNCHEKRRIPNQNSSEWTVFAKSLCISILPACSRREFKWIDAMQFIEHTKGVFERNSTLRVEMLQMLLLMIH